MNKYDIIISHKSAYEDKNSEVLSILENHCKQYNKPLVYFSGGIVSNYYKKNEFNLLVLNSKTFYSQNLKIFLNAFKSDDDNIFMLCYGNRWKINIVLNVLENVNLFIENNKSEQIKYNKFRKLIPEELQQIDYPFHIIEPQENKVSKNQIKDLKNSLISFIKEATDE